MAAINDANETILKIKNIRNIAKYTIRTGIILIIIGPSKYGKIHAASMSPPVVATPFPPLNFKYTGKTCPVITAMETNKKRMWSICINKPIQKKETGTIYKTLL